MGFFSALMKTSVCFPTAFMVMAEHLFGDFLLIDKDPVATLQILNQKLLILMVKNFGMMARHR